jgi:5-methylcytosine-specific restriction enzyme subunit McrC
VGPLPIAEDHTTAETGTAALDFLTAQLARKLTERAEAGLHRSYRERTDSGPFLQGRLDLSTHLREPQCRKDQLHCRYEEFTIDVLCNQVPRAAAERVLASPLLSDGVRAALRRALIPFREVGLVALSPNWFLEASADRLTEAYHPLFDVCRLLLEGLEPGKQSGPIPGPAFLLDMDRVFERYVTAGVMGAFIANNSYTVSVQASHLVNRPASGQPNIHVRPDVTIEIDGQTRTVIDAKWKRHAGCPIMTEDVYQVLAYATALGARHAVLVYPGRRSQIWQYPLANSPLRLAIHRLRVVGSRHACARSLKRLGKALRRTVHSFNHIDC